MGCVELCSIEFYLVLLSSVFPRFGQALFFYHCTSKAFPRKPVLAETWETRFAIAIHGPEMKFL
jgi:hypothetical protein